MDFSISETYLKYALGACAAILVIALFRVFKRGKRALALVGAIASFGLMLLALYLAWPTAAVYATGFLCALLLVVDATGRGAR